MVHNKHGKHNFYQQQAEKKQEETVAQKEQEPVEEPVIKEAAEPAAESEAAAKGAAQAEAAQEEIKQEEAQAKDERDAKIEELQNRLLRLQADFDNFRRRNNEEQLKLGNFIRADVINTFLKVLDNFERAEASLETASDAATLKVGLEKIHKQFEQALLALHVEEIPAQGKPFNPEFHEAVMRGNNPDLPDESIDLVLEKGYKLHDQVIRHSKVRVNSK